MSNISKTSLQGGLVGFGFIMEKGHAAAYRERAATRGDVAIGAVADVCPRRRERARELFPEARIYEDHRALIEAEAGRLDFIDVATPPSDHAPVALTALDAGFHVLCEKPLTTSLDDARAMLERASTRRRVLFPCHNYKHAPVVRAVRDVIAAGTIGDVHLVTLQTFRNTHARGVSEWRPDWRRERRYAGGGIAMDHGSHTFYLAFEWLKSYPTAISARATTVGPYDTEDDFSCSLRFPTGVATAHLSWLAGVRKVLYTIHGDGGAIRVEDDALEIARLRANGMRSYRAEWDFERRDIASDWMDSSHVTWFNSLFDQFREAIDTDDFVGKEAEEAYLCVQLIKTAYASAHEGGRELPLLAWTDRSIGHRSRATLPASAPRVFPLEVAADGLAVDSLARRRSSAR